MANYKRHKQHGSSTCGLCKPEKKVGQPVKENLHYLREKVIDKEIKESKTVC